MTVSAEVCRTYFAARVMHAIAPVHVGPTMVVSMDELVRERQLCKMKSYAHNINQFRLPHQHVLRLEYDFGIKRRRRLVPLYLQQQDRIHLPRSLRNDELKNIEMDFVLDSHIFPASRP